MRYLSLFALGFALAVAGSSRADDATETSTSTATHTAHHDARGHGFEERIQRQQDRLNRMHDHCKISDADYQKLSQELAQAKAEADADIAKGPLTTDERKALAKELQTFNMDFAEALHGAGHHLGCGSTATATGTETSTGTGTGHAHHGHNSGHHGAPTGGSAQ